MVCLSVFFWGGERRTRDELESFFFFFFSLLDDSLMQKPMGIILCEQLVFLDSFCMSSIHIVLVELIR